MVKKKTAKKPIKVDDGLVECPACDSTGTWTLTDDKTVPCRVCDGRGRVEPVKIDPDTYDVGLELSDEPVKKLNIRQQKFCHLYASQKEYFGNGVLSYMDAYSCVNYQTAVRCASRLLKNVHICLFINELLAELVLNDTVVDREIAMLIIQGDDLGIKVKAIQEYNKIKSRVNQNVGGKIIHEHELSKDDRDRLDHILHINTPGKKK